MRMMFALFLFIFAIPLFADTQIQTQIHDIDMGKVDEVPLIFLASGQVVTLAGGKSETYIRLQEAVIKKTWFLITINNKRQIVDLKEIPSPVLTTHNKSMQVNVPYSPSILKDMDQARSFFYDARSTHKEESQCYNRAHVWAYEWRIKNNLYSNKAWLFFTRKFIRKYKFEWWFHVAPMVHVVIDNKVRQRVMDIKYARGPLKLKQWTDIFIRDNATCPVVEKYSDQANFPESGSCFVMKSSMYYYQPVDLEQTELTGSPKTMWQRPEVSQAFLEAFDVTL